MSIRSLWLKQKPRIRRWIVFFAVMLVVWLIVSFAVAYRLTHRHGRRTLEPLPQITWGRIEAARIKTRDGEELGAWFVDGRERAPSVILLHGINGSRGQMLSRAQMLAGKGYAALLITLRAHGDSTGDYHDIGWSARQDVWAGVEYLEKRRPGCPIIVNGNSMGSAAAVFASGELGNRVRGYILESPYQDLKVAVWNRTNVHLPPGLSHVAYAGLRAVGPLFLPHLDRISPLKSIKGVPEDVPVLILAGDADRLARLDEARAIYREVETHGKLVLFPQAGHGNLFYSDRGLYERTVLEFCRGISELATGPSLKSEASATE